MTRPALLLALALPACTDASGAERILRQQGYTEIEITGYRYFMCSEDDTRRTGFRAVAVNGEPVQGVVCAGLLLKGATIRFD